MPEERFLEKDLDFTEFEPPSYEEWRDAAVKSLKGAPFEKKVISKTYEEIDLQPIYWQKDLEELTHVASLPGAVPYVRGSAAAGYLERPWQVCQELWAATPKAFNRAATHDLARGQEALGIVLDRRTRLCNDGHEALVETTGAEGLSLCCLDDLDVALAGVDLTKIPLQVMAGCDALPLVAHTAALCRRRGGATSSLKGCIGADPLGELALEGATPLTLERALDVMAALVVWTGKEAPNLRTVLVRGCPYHDSGGAATQELGFALATGVFYLRALVDRGTPIDDATRSLRFTFSLGSSFFMEIAKIRAARMLWTRIVEAFGGDVEVGKMNIHGRTSAWTKTVFDPYVNMLRNTTEAFSGVIGGVDSLHVRPFDEPIRPATEFSRRVSRNVQLLLQQESHLVQPIDPAGGSWYIETLTDQVAQKSWELFQEVEQRGGMAEALAAGYPQEQVAAVAQRKASSLATRRDVLIGTNLYANPSEEPLEVPAVDREEQREHWTSCAAKYRESAGPETVRTESLASLGSASLGAGAVEDALRAVQVGATMSDLQAALAGGEQGGSEGPYLKSLAPGRAALPFEQLRTSMDRYAAETGRRVTVFLANMGTISDHKPRADFTRRLFEVGGFQVLRNDGFNKVSKAVEAAVESRAEVVVICSTDKFYPDLVPALASKIKAASPEVKVFLAGKPAKEHAAAYLEAGLDDFIFIKTNVLELLNALVPAVGGKSDQPTKTEGQRRDSWADAYGSGVKKGGA